VRADDVGDARDVVELAARDRQIGRGHIRCDCDDGSIRLAEQRLLGKIPEFKFCAARVMPVAANAT